MPCCSRGGRPNGIRTDPGAPRPEQGLLGLRKELGLFANLRPVRPSPALLDASPLKRERIEGTDLLVVRELTGGIYFGERGLGRRHRARHLRLQRGRDRAHRARGVPASAQKVTSVDKANVLETSRLWRKIVEREAEGQETPARTHARRQCRHAARLAAGRVRRGADREPVRRHPQRRSRHAHRLAGDAAERVAREAGPGLFEPVHGSAPDIAGTGRRIRWRCSARWR